MWGYGVVYPERGDDGHQAVVERHGCGPFLETVVIMVVLRRIWKFGESQLVA